MQRSFARNVALAVSLAVSAAAAGQKPARETGFQVLPGQRIRLMGDSISKGYGFGNYTDPSPLRTIPGIAQILLRDNQQGTIPFEWLAPAQTGKNPDFTPKTTDTLAGELQMYHRRGDLRNGDWLVYEDAGQLNMIVEPGPTPNSKDMYQRYRRMLRGLIAESEQTVGRDHLLLMTMFDYEPRYPMCAWDVPLDDGVHTGNDAVRDEAAAQGVRVVDMNRIMDRAHEYVERAGWGRMVGPDGIHPNVYGNAVIVFAILGAFGTDVGNWKLEGLDRHFRHPEAGGDVRTVWGFTKDPSDEERAAILRDLRDIVAREFPSAVIEPDAIRSSRGRQFIRHGRLVDHPSKPVDGAAKPISYEIGKLFQLDRDTVLMTAAMREQGGHDFEIGNDGFIFQTLSDIRPERAIPINRFDPGFRRKSGAPAVLARFPVNGGFLPKGAVNSSGQEYSGAGTGFFLGTALAFKPDRSDSFPDAEQFVSFQQARWEGGILSVETDALPAPLDSRLINVGFNCLFDAGTFLCPLVSTDGIVMVRFVHNGKRWHPAATGKPFRTSPREVEPSVRKTSEGYLVYTRGISDRRGRVYRSFDGLDYYLAFDHWNWTVPQALNQGLDGSLYLTTNTGPGMLRNPLLAFELRGQSFVDPVIVHDEKQIGDDKGKEVPFCDHAIAENVFLGRRWRHLLLYRVCDLRETNGEGTPPYPQTGLYLAEREYAGADAGAFTFRK